MKYSLYRITGHLVFIALVGFGQSLLAAAETEENSTRPNIIWLMAEDMGLDLECYGMPGVKTPNLNRLANEGALFTKAYCSSPICSPNRSAMMVGVDQFETNTQHHRSNREVPLMAPYRPITSPLRQAGYTCLLGHSKVLQKGTKTDCNFKHKAVGPYDGVTQFGLFDAQRDFTAADQPFFSQIQLKVTHRGDWWNGVRRDSTHPVALEDVVLPPFMADTREIRYDWATYLDTVEYMDDEVGVIMQSIKDEGIEDNTIVIFIADNGRCNLRGKGYLQEPGIHVPMIVWAPGYIEAGSVIQELISTTDIPATIMSLAEAEIPDYIQARPFMGEGALLDRSYVRSARDIWDEIDECSRSITTNGFKYIRNYMPEVPWATDQAYLELNRPAMHVMRTLKAEGKLSGAELIFMADSKPAEELYDLTHDPDEMHNLVSDSRYAWALEELRGLETRWQEGHRDFGLEDLGHRQPEQNLGAQVAREGVKQQRPDLWARLERGELMETQTWAKKYRPAEK